MPSSTDSTMPTTIATNRLPVSADSENAMYAPIM